MYYTYYYCVSLMRLATGARKRYYVWETITLIMERQSIMCSGTDKVGSGAKSLELNKHLSETKPLQISRSGLTF